jgi:hypothetical protein
MNGRVQDAVTGRFLSADPYITEPGNTQGFNRYAYVQNNPLTFTDPSGFSPWDRCAEAIVRGYFVAGCESVEANLRELANSGSLDRGTQICTMFQCNPTGDLYRDGMVGTRIGYCGGLVNGNESCHYEYRWTKGPGVLDRMDKFVFNNFVKPTFGWLDCATRSGTRYECSRAEAIEVGVGFAMAVIPIPVKVPVGSIAETSGKALLGQNAREAGGRTATDLAGNLAAAKSIFRNQARGQKVTQTTMQNGGIRRTAADGTQIRINPDGTARLDLPGRGRLPNGETIHFPLEP